jgi:hypothetical protein
MCKLKRLDRKEFGILAGLIAATVLGLVIAMLANDGDSVIGGPDDQPTQTPLTLEEIPLEAKVVKVAGKLPDQARRTAAGEIDEALTGYVAWAFLGSYPRLEKVPAPSTFVPGLADEVQRDALLLSGARWAETDTFVSPGKLTARLGILATGKRATGITATYSFNFVAETGEDTESVTFTGRLMFTKVDGEWRIFGYDVAAPQAAAPAAASDEGADQ